MKLHFVILSLRRIFYIFLGNNYIQLRLFNFSTAEDTQCQYLPLQVIVNGFILVIKFNEPFMVNFTIALTAFFLQANLDFFYLVLVWPIICIMLFWSYLIQEGSLLLISLFLSLTLGLLWWADKCNTWTTTSSVFLTRWYRASDHNMTGCRATPITFYALAMGTFATLVGFVYCALLNIIASQTQLLLNKESMLSLGRHYKWVISRG